MCFVFSLNLKARLTDLVFFLFFATIRPTSPESY